MHYVPENGNGQPTEPYGQLTACHPIRFGLNVCSLFPYVAALPSEEEVVYSDREGFAEGLSKFRHTSLRTASTVV